MATPTRFVNGVSTAGIGRNLGNYPVPDPTKVFTLFRDFDQYVAGDWTVTNTTSHATIALAAGAGGVLNLAGGGSSVSTDLAGIQTNPFNFNFIATSSNVVGNQVWFYTRLKVATAANDQLLFGLSASNATAAPSDGIYFNKAAGSTSVDFIVRKSSTSTTTSAVATMANNTYIGLGFYYNPNGNNGGGQIDVFVNEVKVASVTNMTNLPVSTSLGAGVVTKLAATSPTTSSLSVDFLLAAQDRGA